MLIIMLSSEHVMLSSLVTDLYQLTMAQGYFRAGKLTDQAVFHLYFRRLPFRGGYAVAAGLESALELIESFRFEPALSTPASN